MIRAIPTNVITGFLGVGKSTAVLNLLKMKPSHQRWAVLVNEFGEVGIDGSLFEGQGGEKSGIFIREVPGGCMCCAAGLPMQMALNMLLTRAKPDRLLIEPTGLGHPKEVLAVLRNQHYREVLDLQTTITLVDARKVQDQRYATHATFKQQLAIADVVVANKSDQYGQADFPALLSFLESTDCLKEKSVYQVSHGQLELDWLCGPAQPQEAEENHAQEAVRGDSGARSSGGCAEDIPSKPDEGYFSVDNEGEGFFSRGWIFTPDQTFDAGKLRKLLSATIAERVKGVFITHQGVLGFNKADGLLSEVSLDDCLDSRIECIAFDKDVFESLELGLHKCLT